MNLNEVVIETKRLKLVPINENHIAKVYQHFTISVSRYMYPQPTGHVEDAENFVRTSMEGLKEGTNLQLVIIDKVTNKFIGCIGLHNIGSTDPELGVWVRNSRQSYGYGLEAIRGLISWARENVEYEYMRYPVDRHNRSSRRIPLSVGGKFVKSYKKLNMTGTKELDIVEYWIN